MTGSNDKLSYLLDDYAGDGAESSLEDALEDVNLQYRLRRYRMIGEIIRGELPAAIDTSFHASVMAKIETGEGGQRSRQAAPAGLSTPGWLRLRPLAGLAVAATVAVVTVVIWQPLQREAGQPAETLVSAEQQKIAELAEQQPQGDVVRASTSLQGFGTRWKFDQNMPGMQEKLNAYLVNHTEYSNSMQGLIPQARVAGFDAQR